MGKYFKYAIGEIILVVIGILIALQINNWNEHRKTLNLETAFVEGVKKDLQADLKEIERIKTAAERKVELFGILKNDLLELYQNNKQKSDSLCKLYFVSQITFFPISGTFDAAVSTNEIGKFKNRDLNSKIMKLYNATYQRLLNNGDIMDERWNFISQTYGYERMVGKLKNNMSNDELLHFLGDLSYNTKVNEYYKNKLEEAEIEIKNILAYD